MGGIVRNFLLALLLAGSVAGCASSQGFDRGRMDQELSRSMPKTTDAEMARVLALKPQLDFPFRLAVYVRSGGYGWNRTVWTADDVDIAWVQKLKDEGLVSEFIPIVESTVTGHGIADIRLAAARHHADAVLVLDSVSDVDRYNNPLAFMYVTIVGAWLVPGTHSDALVVTSGSLWDVRNGYLYATARAEGESSDFGPAFLLEDYTVVEKAQRKSLNNLEQELLPHLQNLRQAS